MRTAHTQRKAPPMVIARALRYVRSLKDLQFPSLLAAFLKASISLAHPTTDFDENGTGKLLQGGHM